MIILTNLRLFQLSPLMMKSPRKLNAFTLKIVDVHAVGAGLDAMLDHVGSRSSDHHRYGPSGPPRRKPTNPPSHCPRDWTI
jgi:hypothetical protein